MPGVGVGDTFVDTYGICWYVDGTTVLPITNVVFAGTVYDNTDCNEGTCVDDNPCPTFFYLQSCCYQGALQGITTSIILGPSYVVNDVFVDQFGICWLVKSISEATFPTLAAITPVTDYGFEGCADCITDNTCPETLFYEVQNCCTEEIEIVELNPFYNVGNILAIRDSMDNRECWKILSFSNGPATYTFSLVQGNYGLCEQCISDYLGGECPTP
jgi:hypothetical protein